MTFFPEMHHMTSWDCQIIFYRKIIRDGKQGRALGVDNLVWAQLT